MHPQLKTLYNLQLADTHLRKDSESLQRLDWGEKQAKAIVALRQQAVALAAERARLDAAIKESEKALSTTESRIKRSRGRVDKGEIHNEHELESTEKEIVVLVARKGELEETILSLMDEAAAIPEMAQDIRAREQALLKEREAIRKRSTEEKARLEGDIAAVTLRRSELSGQLPADIRRRYEHMTTHSSGVAVVRIVSGACDACRVAVSPATVREVLETADLVGCQGCGRYLYTETD